MDLRKKLLMKVPLQENSFISPNASLYESAGEDSDSDSMYFSFSNSSVKEFDLSYTENRDLEPSENLNNHNPNELESSPTSDTESKDDTVIMMEHDKTMENICEESKLEESNKENMSVREMQKVDNETTSNLDLKIEPVNRVQEDKQTDNAVAHVQTPELEAVLSVKSEKKEVERSKMRTPFKVLRIPFSEEDTAFDVEESQLDAEEPPEEMEVDAGLEASNENKVTTNDIAIESSVQIVIEDPNENIVNPFTFGASSESPGITTDIAALSKSAKKSSSKIPTRRSHFYSPLQRLSIDRKAKIVIKPTALRRTIYQTSQAGTTSSVKTQLTKSTSSSKLKPSASKPSTSTASTSLAAKPATVKPKLVLAAFKCTFPNCNREFRSGIAYQAHIKSHNSTPPSVSSGSSTSSTSCSFKCKWCDKTFGLSLPLTNHMIEACTKIPFGERRKLIAEQEKKKPVNNKRKSMFIAPEPVIRRRSPSRRQTVISRKSGVVTPKKTMKCHVDGCGQLFTDVLSFANHMVSHKYDGVLPAATKQA